MRSGDHAQAGLYIHPLADGNGRVHRFLINDILRRDGAVPDPIILPVSAIITDDVGERRNYDQVLNDVSKRLMHQVRARRALKEIVEMPDPQADRILRSIQQNDGELSNVLAKTNACITTVRRVGQHRRSRHRCVS